MNRSLWFNPAVGVAGDMVIAALLDVGADEHLVRGQLAALGLDGWKLEVTSTRRCELTATGVDVLHDEEHHHRSWSHIDGLIAGAALRPAVIDGARATFRALASAEAAVHGIDLDEVHFHEVGAIDAIVDIVGAWAALESLGVEHVVCAPIGIGTGLVPMAHGEVPVPAPATLELLVGRPTVPVEPSLLPPGGAETATPTGVALLVTMVDSWGAMPAGVVAASGRGAGSRDPEAYANVLGTVLLDEVLLDEGLLDEGLLDEGLAAVDVAGTEVRSVVVETNVDDVTPEVLAHVVERLLALGADDAWVSPIVMKKGRPAHQLSALCRPELTAAVRELLAAETGSLGFRQRTVDKFELDRRIDEVDVHGEVVRIKVGPHGAKPEHDDVVRVATHTGLPIRDVAADAIRSWASEQARTPRT